MHPGEIAAKTPDKTAYVIAETGHVVTFKELDDLSMRGSQLFRSLGLKRGDHIAIMMENHQALLQITLAAQRSGLYFTAISYRLQEEEVDYIVSDCQARVFITSKAQQAVVEKMNLDHCDKSYMLDGVIAGFESWEDAIEDMPAEKIADESKEDLFMKIHDAFTYLPDNRPMIPSKATLGVFYFLRNPLDVAVSFAHHNAGTIDQTISDMKNEKLSIYGNSKKLNSQLRQKLLSWNSHVNSWLNASDVSVYLMRYEDMHLNPIPTFQAAARFANLPDTKERIKKALKFCDFNVLKKQEKDHGFREKIPFAESFFRKGKVGSWRETLSNEQAQKIIDDHRDTMSRFGYLDGNEKPIF